LFTKVKTLTYQVKKAASNAAKPAKKQEKLIGEIEKPVNVPPLPAGLKVWIVYDYRLKHQFLM
jgi:hypothetical protein